MATGRLVCGVSDVKTRTRVLSHYDDDGERCDGAERPRVFVANDGTYEMRHDAALHPVARARVTVWTVQRRARVHTARFSWSSVDRSSVRSSGQRTRARRAGGDG